MTGTCLINVLNFPVIMCNTLRDYVHIHPTSSEPFPLWDACLCTSGYCGISMLNEMAYRGY